ncbi:retron St85 family RNA-directed DNA polymerase [Bradyrhizobium sp. HKCCYLS3013]|uniref:retron St85 family RNA-directed DNA polymerase n=1 Tax=Bradyrhizobium sp. HKCCYLS3013 TaxID=3420735 RepID=UPI003EC01AB0
MSPLINTLIAETGLSEHDILRIVSNAPRRYKTYTIPKRNGGRRIISQPARELKALQRIVVSEVLSKLPVHSSAMAYRTGLSIRDNAAAHVNNGPILKFDFKDFFPSIIAKDWIRYCKEKNIFSDPGDIGISTQLLFQKSSGSSKLRLAIGAPSSPCVSNILMSDFDTKIAQLVSQDQVTYTRYADDLTFSAKRTGFLNRVEKFLKQVLREVESPQLILNDSKTVTATKKYKRFVTGLVLANDNHVSLGHHRKRSIRAAVHHYTLGKLDLEEQVRLAGMLAFAYGIEPAFVSRLENKYSSAVLQQLKTVKLPPRSF